MNEREAIQLLAYCAAFDNRQPSQAAAAAWASALHDVPLDADTKSAVNAYYSTAPKDPGAKLWILPHNIRSLRISIRSKRLENFQYEPAADETPTEYLDRYRSQVQAIASGRVPAPTVRPALEGAPSREFMAELEAGGWNGMRAVPGPSEETEELPRSFGPLGVACPTCRAPLGRPCKRPGATEKHPLGKPRLNPHGARHRAAQGFYGQDAEQRAADEKRIRAMADRHLAREHDEEGQ